MRPQLVGSISNEGPQQLPPAAGSSEGTFTPEAPPAVPPPLPMPTVPYPAVEIPMVPQSWFQAHPLVIPIGGSLLALLVGLTVGVAIGKRLRA